MSASMESRLLRDSSEMVVVGGIRGEIEFGEGLSCRLLVIILQLFAQGKSWLQLSETLPQVCSILSLFTYVQLFASSALQELSDKKDLVHRDISYNNVLLLELEDGDSDNLCSGLLIDFEYAASRSLSRGLAAGSRTVRNLFLCHLQSSSICITGNGIIYGNWTSYEEAGDMPYPSTRSRIPLFVLDYLCTNLSGPGAIRTQDELQLHSIIPLLAWFKVSSTLHQIGIHKIGTLCTLKSNILDHFAPYFNELKPCISISSKQFMAIAYQDPLRTSHMMK